MLDAVLVAAHAEHVENKADRLRKIKQIRQIDLTDSFGVLDAPIWLGKSTGPRKVAFGKLADVSPAGGRCSVTRRGNEVKIHVSKSGITMLLRQNLNRLPNYIKRFGTFQGTKLFCKVYSACESIPIPGYPHPVRLRQTASDTSTFFQVLVKEEYSAAAWPQYDQLLDEYKAIIAAGRQPFIIDAGGNIGLAAIWFAKAFPEARIITIEPDQENLVILQSNVAPYKNISVLAGGVWHKSARLQIDNPAEGSAGFMVSEAHDGPIRGYSIPDILKNEHEIELFIIKIDIEGAEQHLFQGDLGWCRNARLITIETHDWLLPWQGTSHLFWKCISSLDADILFRGENVFVFNRHGAPHALAG